MTGRWRRSSSAARTRASIAFSSSMIDSARNDHVPSGRWPSIGCSPKRAPITVLSARRTGAPHDADAEGQLDRPCRSVAPRASSTRRSASSPRRASVCTCSSHGPTSSSRSGAPHSDAAVNHVAQRARRRRIQPASSSIHSTACSTRACGTAPSQASANTRSRIVSASAAHALKRVVAAQPRGDRRQRQLR